VELIHELRLRLPWVPVLYLADGEGSKPEIERELHPGVAILREPFTVEQLREAVRPLLTEY
jgi:hypothetical protein